MLFSSTKSQSQESNEPPSPPDRSKRAVCWSSRDTYYACLKENHQRQVKENSSLKYYFVPGEEPSSICNSQRKNFHMDCAQSWVEHFNQRIVNEQRSTATRLALNSPSNPTPSGSR
ncbi:hypothetical protein CROQUDRAFT_52153 [Cronartium quercuum f. sp. fusiforme G11]|uniref:Uncharacterized protein n=1 Tax=Cronartium quercuum f. sp. fusiforme G11 TaxID=708437 RepID=A0A9P6N7A3_9BASI|nr:hypothetical protein CROQUDRAFT_52153 [Cronartium quercuum f. sp. fusiforme G11]